MPETSRSFHYWQPAPRWRPFLWLANPGNPAMSPHAEGRTGTRHTGKQWKEREGRGGGTSLRTCSHTKPLTVNTIPVMAVNTSSLSTLLTSKGMQVLLVVNSVKLHLSKIVTNLSKIVGYLNDDLHVYVSANYDSW